MLRSADELKGLAITATDGAIGEIDQFYFDDEDWAVRYLVANTGTWSEDRQVLISPFSIEKVDLPGNQLFVNLTMKQVLDSPDIDTHKPVSRQHEADYLNYYGYPLYWGGPYLWGSEMHPAGVLAMPAIAQEAAVLEAAVARAPEDSGDIHLRSTAEVRGYRIQAIDGEIGHVEDFVIEDDSWAIRYVVVDTRNWWPGGNVLVSPQWVTNVDWAERKVFINLTKEAIKSSPAYDKSRLISRDYESALYGHYQKSGYWGEGQSARR